MVTLPVLLDRLAPFVRTRRKQAGYSQERFASAVGVHRTYMGLIERGKANNPTIKILDAIAQRLGLDLMEMLTLAMADDATATPPADTTATRASPSSSGQTLNRPAGRQANAATNLPDPRRGTRRPAK
jgi:transcriptional regulator with XRE-family HTH domain